MTAEVADLLDRAAQRLRTKGWQQGARGSEEGPNCAAAAIWWEEVEDGLYGQADDALARVIDDPEGRVTRWNDAPGRTVEQVLDVFARAAAAERAE